MDESSVSKSEETAPASSEETPDQTTTTTDVSQQQADENEKPELKQEIVEDAAETNVQPQIAKKITLTVKTPKEKEVIETSNTATVAEFKELVAPKFNADVEQLCLIFAGRILKDAETLVSQNIKDGLTVHLVIKSVPRPSDSNAKRPPADISQTPFHLGTVGGIAGLETLGMGTSTFMDLQNRMQTELLTNPELLRRVLDNPLVQHFNSNPEAMRVLLSSNPQMQELMSRNPEINQMLNNSELLRQTMELARNPSMLQELMRSHDRNLNNLENPQDNSFTRPAGEAAGASGNAETKPNPADVNTGNFFTNPPLISLMQQIYENPHLIQNMLSASYTQSMIQALTSNTNVQNAFVESNPLLQGNPTLQGQIRGMMPQFMQQLQNPEVENLLTNPQAIDAVMQIQQGMETLHAAAPCLISTLNIPSADTQETSTTISDFQQYTDRMLNWMSCQYNSSLSPGERYQPQMAQLNAMGFINTEENLQALIATSGDINAAIRRLIVKQ